MALYCNSVELYFLRVRHSVNQYGIYRTRLPTVYEARFCSSFLNLIRRDELVSLAMDIDNLNLVIVLEMLAQLRDVDIH